MKDTITNLWDSVEIIENFSVWRDRKTSIAVAAALALTTAWCSFSWPRTLGWDYSKTGVPITRAQEADFYSVEKINPDGIWAKNANKWYPITAAWEASFHCVQEYTHDWDCSIEAMKNFRYNKNQTKPSHNSHELNTKQVQKIEDQRETEMRALIESITNKLKLKK